MASTVTGPVYSMSAPLVGKKRYLGKMLSMSLYSNSLSDGL